jgi:hypothetical protein
MSTEREHSNGGQTPKEFQLVEYAEKWAYLRHIEALRLSFAQWFVLIVGGLLAFTLSGTDSLANQTRRFERTSILGFLVIYSLLLQLFMWAQKNYYNQYVEHVRGIENALGDSVRGIKELRLEPFRIFQVLIAIIGAGISEILVMVWKTRLSEGLVILLLVSGPVVYGALVFAVLPQLTRPRTSPGAVRASTAGKSSGAST